MSDDVLITPASRKIEFKDNSGNVDGKIELDANGNLNITSPGGDIGLGDATADVYIGDGTNNVDIVFEQNGEIRGLTGRTLTLGQSDSNVTVTAQNFTANGLSYPTSDGTNGQVLTTNGSGDLSFSTISSSGAYDLNGGRLTIDADGDTYIEASSSGTALDDYFEFTLGGSPRFFMNSSMFGPKTGQTGTTIGSSNQSFFIGYITNLYSTTLNATTLNAATCNITGDITSRHADDAVLTVHSDTTTTPTAALALMRGTNDTYGADNYVDWKVENGYGSGGSAGGTLSILRTVDGAADTYYMDFYRDASPARHHIDMLQDVDFQKAIREKAYNLTGTALDPSNGTLQYKTLSANTTFTESFVDGESITLMIDDGSSYTVTWPTMTWASGSAPTLATSGYTTVVLWHRGGLYGAVVS